MNNNKPEDLVIYELQYWLDKAELLLKGIRADSNPLYLKRQATSYFDNKKKESEKNKDSWTYTYIYGDKDNV